MDTGKEAQRKARKWGCQDFGPGFSDSRIQDCAQRVEPQHSVQGTSWGGRGPWPPIVEGRGLLNEEALDAGLAELETLMMWRSIEVGTQGTLPEQRVRGLCGRAVMLEGVDIEICFITLLRLMMSSQSDYLAQAHPSLAGESTASSSTALF